MNGKDAVERRWRVGPVVSLVQRRYNSSVTERREVMVQFLNSIIGPV